MGHNLAEKRVFSAKRQDEGLILGQVQLIEALKVTGFLPVSTCGQAHNRPRRIYGN